MTKTTPVAILVLFVGLACGPSAASRAGDEPLEYRLELTSAAGGFDGQTCWVHARAGAIPAGRPGNPGPAPRVVMTMQKLLLTGSDVFYALHNLWSDDLGKTWTEPKLQPVFERQKRGENIEMTVCDFWPKWHAASGKLLGTGHTVWYQNNRVMPVRKRHTAYAVYDPAARAWLPWKELELPGDPRFANAGAGCTQRFDLPNGDILLPIYFKRPEDKVSSTTVVRCRFDGDTLHYVEHGDELSTEVPRGFGEPSLAKFGDRFFLTIRNDQKGYVASGPDGLRFDEPQPWTFDDGTELGNYNTQQHWVAHSDGLFLVYTRRGADNDHVFRHRAPLFMARVDPQRLCVIRSTERVLVPERGARLGILASRRSARTRLGSPPQNGCNRGESKNGAATTVSGWQRSSGTNRTGTSRKGAMMKPTASLTRRQFVQTAAAAAAAVTIVPRHVLGGPKFVPPSDKVNVALIGAGGQGRSNLRELFHLDDVQVTALADPCTEWDLDRFYYKGKGGRLPVKAEIEKHYSEKTPNFRAADYEDFRVMLDKEKAIDAVLIATPDHLHAYASLVAMRQGKHTYCEKPLTHNIREARLVAEVARQTGVATQMGNPGHSRDGIRQTCEWIWAGAIGAVREVHSWVPTNRWNPELAGLPQDTPPVPAGLNWDLWIGPREPRPWHPAYAPVTWRDFWAFGTGSFGDFGCHDMDAPCWALDLAAPDSVEAFGVGASHPEIQPHGCLCYYRFPATERRPVVKLTWYDGGLMPELPAAYDRTRSKYRRGVLFVGEKGFIACEGAGGPPQLALLDPAAIFDKPQPSLKRSAGHHRDWIDACKGGPPASSNFEYGARLTEITLLGVLALRLGKKIAWDAAQMQVPGVPAADEIIQGTYRTGWEVM